MTSEILKSVALGSLMTISASTIHRGGQNQHLLISYYLKFLVEKGHVPSPISHLVPFQATSRQS